MRRAARHGALALSILAACAAVTLAGPARRGHPTRATQSPSALPPPAIEDATWSGELAWAFENGATAFDQVAGAWTQPSIATSSSAQYADTWVGIDGLDGTLLQAGTTAWTHGGSVSYAAWFVAWTGAPSGMTVIREPVASGDRMAVTIDRQGSRTWHVTLADRSAGWTWSTTVTYPATGASAEWIEEAPGTWSTLADHKTLADYGAATFTTVRANGHPPTAVTTYEIAQHGAVVSYPTTYDPARGSFTMHYALPAPAAAASAAPAPEPTPTQPRGGSGVVFAGGGRRAFSGS